MKRILCNAFFENKKLKTENGIVNPINDFCNDNINSEKCLRFYNKVILLKDGVYTCPYFFNCIKNKSKIYNSLLIKDKFNLTKIKAKKGKNQKVFPLSEIEELIELNNNITETEELNIEQTQNINDFFHDITKANGMADTKINQISKEDLNDINQNLIESVSKLSDFIKKRIQLYRYISNPTLVASGEFRIRDAYGLWKIYKYIFDAMAGKNQLSIILRKYEIVPGKELSKQVLFKGKDSVTILPFLLIDNAVKYSKANTEIIVEFYQSDEDLKEMRIISTSSYKVTESVDELFTRGYRSKTNTSKSTGSGLGLSIVKQICDTNNININIEILKKGDDELFCVILKY